MRLARGGRAIGRACGQLGILGGAPRGDRELSESGSDLVQESAPSPRLSNRTLSSADGRVVNGGETTAAEGNGLRVRPNALAVGAVVREGMRQTRNGTYERDSGRAFRIDGNGAEYGLSPVKERCDAPVSQLMNQLQL